MKQRINCLLITILISFNCVFAQNNIQHYLFENQDNVFYSAPSVNPNYYIEKPLQQNSSSENISNILTPIIYLHLYGGMGLSILSSSKIESIFGDEFGIGIGLPTWSWGFISGYKNIVQVEYNNGISDHDFNNNSIIPDIPSEVIKMDYETTDLQFKLNPLFWNMAGNKAYFIIIGTGDVNWRDKDNDGFKGTSQIFGIEYAQFSKFVSWSVSFKRYGIIFKETILFNIPFDFKTKASDYIFEVKIGFGYGV